MASRDDECPAVSLSALLAELPDPRVERTRLHPLRDIILLTLIAVVCGADDWVAVQAYGEMNEEWLKEFLELPNGIPSHDTLGRVFRMLDSTELSTRLGRWLEALQEPVEDEQVCVDGKTLRRAFDAASGRSPLHVINAWAAGARIALGQVGVEGKENEIVAIPRLLKLLDLKKRLVTLDAMGCQKEIARVVVEGGGDYLLRVKDNQPTLHAEMRTFFLDAEKDGFRHQKWTRFEETEGDHGRIEVRQTWACDELAWFEDHSKWADLRSVVVQRNRREANGKVTENLHVYISTRPATDVERLAHAARRHWAVENELHWVLDMAFDEDWSRVRRDNAALNLAAIRRLAVSILRKNTTLKVGVANRRRAAGWNRAFLTRTLLGR
jgi:predicted transposase YbfD/YdcC